jgi:hypothetical protein
MPKLRAVLIALALVLSGIIVTVPTVAVDIELHGAENPRVVLAELYIDCQDTESPNAHQAMQRLEAEYGRDELIILAWHGNDALAFSEGNERITIAGVTDYPTAVFDGNTANVGGGSTVDEVMVRYDSHIDPRTDYGSPLRMTVEWDYDVLTGKGTSWVNITAVENISLSDLRLHTVIFENDVGPYDGGNGEIMHDFVARDFLETEGADGAPLTIANGQTKNFVYTFDADYAEDWDEIGVMAFVQNNGTSKEVLQAAYVGVKVLPNIPPVLSSAEMDISAGGTEDNDVVFKVFYKDVDDDRNKGPIDPKVMYKNTTSNVTEKDLVPEIIDPWVDGNWLTYTTLLGAGSYTFKFSASDDNDLALGDVDWSTTPVIIKPRNKLPELNEANHAPDSGDTSTMFRYEVMYRDLDNVMPVTTKIVIDGTEYTMSTDSSGPWDSWVTFYYETTMSVGSSHQHYFMFSDGDDGVRYPSEFAVPNWIAGPTISEPNNVPTLTTPAFSPEEGTRTTDFEFSIIYTDGENDSPVMSRIYINNRPYIMTSDTSTYNTGVVFTHKTKLDLGLHKYYFLFDDGVNEVRHPKADAFDGPDVVNQDPEAIIDLPRDGDVYEPGELIRFDASYSMDPDWDPISFEWISDIGGLLGDHESFDMHLSVGLHTIVLEVVDDYGGKDSVTFKITVLEEVAHAYFVDYTVDPEPLREGDIVLFGVTINNKGQLAVEDQLVDFRIDDIVIGNPTVDVEVNTPITLSMEWTAEAGNHIVTLTMGTEVLQFFMKVASNDPPDAELDPRDPKGNPITKPKTDQEITFHANAADHEGDMITYFWDFGDGTNSTEENPIHTYDKPGDYTVTMVVTDCHGGVCTETVQMEVTKPAEEESPGFGTLVAASAMIVALMGAAMMRRRKWS